MADHQAEVAELLRAVGREHGVAVRRRLDRRHLDRAGGPHERMPTRHRREDRRHHRHRHGDAVEQRDIDVRALPGALRRPPRRDGADGGVGARDPLAESATDGRRGAVGVAAGAGRAAQACSVNSVAGRPTHGPSHPYGVIVTTTNAGLPTPQASRSTGSSTTTRTSASASSFNNTRFDRLRTRNNAPGAPRPERIAAVRLDLDHVGAGVGEQLRAVRPGDLGGAVEDPDAVEHGVRLSPDAGYGRMRCTSPNSCQR